MIAKILFVLTMIGAFIGIVDMAMLPDDASAPQAAARAAMALCWGVLPYCLARAWQEIARPEPKAPPSAADAG
jgi:hypothetical protein